jgi:hypothetical protein
MGMTQVTVHINNQTKPYEFCKGNRLFPGVKRADELAYRIEIQKLKISSKIK